jgi:hypothetical protein
VKQEQAVIGLRGIERAFDLGALGLHGAGAAAAPPPRAA